MNDLGEIGIISDAFLGVRYFPYLFQGWTLSKVDLYV